jgi:diketogulonate reductase-like aldo/keto reductase
MTRKKFLILISTLLYSIRNSKMEADSMSETSKIPTREIPSSNEKIPILGFGTWRVFDEQATEANLNRLVEVWNMFQLHGGRLIDSSPMYGNAETFIGELFERYRNKDTFLATKVWTTGKSEGLKQINSSFQKMKSKSIDLFQVHNLVDIDTQLATLRDLKEKGQIRYIGITHYVTSYFDKMEAIIKKEKIDFIQIPYSISLRNAETRILPFAKDRGVAVLINRPFEGGALFAEVLKKPIDPRLLDMGITSWAHLFIQFLVANTDLTCILFASSKPSHVEENMKAAKKPILDKKDLEKAYKIFKTIG